MSYLGDDDVPPLHAALELLLAANPPRAEGTVNPVLHVARVRENKASLLSQAPAQSIRPVVEKNRNAHQFFVCMLVHICCLLRVSKSEQLRG